MNKYDSAIAGITAHISADRATGKDYTVIRYCCNPKYKIGDKFNIRQHTLGTQTYEITGVNCERMYLLEGLEHKNKLTLRESDFEIGFCRYNDKYIQEYAIVERVAK